MGENIYRDPEDLPHRERHALGQARPGPLDVLRGELGDPDRALIPSAEDRDQHRRLEVEPGVLVRFLEAVDDGRHVAQPQAAAVGPRS